MEFVHEARELVCSQLEKEGGYLSMLCYNFGLDAFQKGSCESSVCWLKESYELGQGSSEVGAVKQVGWVGVSLWGGCVIVGVGGCVTVEWFVCVRTYMCAPL